MLSKLINRDFDVARPERIPIYAAVLGENVGPGDETFFKVGVTKDLGQRFAFGATKVVDSSLPLKDKVEMVLAGRTYIPDCPYRVEVLHSVSFKFEGDALVAERALLKTTGPRQYWPAKEFSGRSECFKGEDLLGAIVEYMDTNSKHKNASAPSELLYALHSHGVRETDPIKRHMIVIEKCRQAKP